MSAAPAQTPARFELAYWAENWYFKDLETGLYGPPQTSYTAAKIHVDELNKGAFTAKAYPWEPHPDRFGYPPFEDIGGRKRRKS